MKGRKGRAVVRRNAGGVKTSRNVMTDISVIDIQIPNVKFLK